MFISRGIQNGCVCNLLLFQQVGHLWSIMLLISKTVRTIFVCEKKMHMHSSRCLCLQHTIQTNLCLGSNWDVNMAYSSRLSFLYCHFHVGFTIAWMFGGLELPRHSRTDWLTKDNSNTPNFNFVEIGIKKICMQPPFQKHEHRHHAPCRWLVIYP